MEIELEQKDQDLLKAQNDISNLTASIQHYQEAYKTTLNNLEIRSNEQSEIQTLLNSKIAEIVELEQELKKANDLVGLREVQNNEIHTLTKQIYKTIIVSEEEEEEKDLDNKKTIKTQVEEIKAASEMRNNEIQALANKLKIFEEKTENLEIDIHCLNQTIQQLQNEKSNLEKLVTGTQEEASNQLEDLMSQLQTKETQINTIKSQLHSLYLKVTGVKDAQYVSEAIDDLLSDLESTIIQKDQELNSLQLQAQDLSTKIANLETLTSQQEESLEERKKRIDQLTIQIDNLEMIITQKHQEIDKQAADIKNESLRVAELETNLLQKDQSVQKLQKELEESIAKTSFMQAELNDAKLHLPDLESSLQKEKSRKVGYKQIIKNLKEQLREEQNKTQEKETFVENFGQKERFYTQQIDELTKQLNDALQAASGDQHKNKELSSKISLLEKDVEEKSQLLKDYIKQMRQMQNKIDAQIGLIVDTEGLKQVRQENASLKSEVKKQEDLVLKLSTEATDYCNQQEQEINRIKESYAKLAKQYEIIQAEASHRTLETTKDKDEIKQLVQEIK